MLSIRFEIVTDRSTGCPSNAVAAALTTIATTKLIIDGAETDATLIIVGDNTCKLTKH